MKRFFLIYAAITTLICGANRQLHGQTTTDATATVQFSDGQSVSISDFSNPIPIHPDEIVNITIQFISDNAGEAVTVDAPDGGSVNIGGKVVVIGDDGSLSLIFRAGDGSGQQSVNVREASKTLSLQFWVSDSSNG